jgi:signal peptidase I
VDFIKRIVGLPGDTVAYRDKVLYVNGQVQKQAADGVYSASRLPGGTAHRISETLGEVEHHIIVNPEEPSQDFEYTVPEGHYFALGDNRDGSFDSRGWGTVDERLLVGKAFFIWMNWDSQLGRPGFSRIGTRIR